MAFTKEYLKDYEAKIRKLPLEELYDIISLIRDNPIKADESPERVRIVEKRIEELENSPAAIDHVKDLNEKLETEYKKKPHLLSFVLQAIGYTLLFFTILALNPKIASQEAGINVGFLLFGIAMILFMYAGLIDKRITIQTDRIHKEAYPILYWINIVLFFIIGVAGIFLGNRPIFQ